MSFPHAMPAPAPMAGPPAGVQAHQPLSAMFHSLAARSLAGKGGRPASPGIPQAGAPIPLANNGAPARPYGHAPAMGPR